MFPSLHMTASSFPEGAWFRSDGEDGSADSEQKTLPGVAVVYSRSLIKKERSREICWRLLLWRSTAGSENPPRQKWFDTGLVAGERFHMLALSLLFPSCLVTAVHETQYWESGTEPVGLCASVVVICEHWHGISHVLILFLESYFEILCQFTHN